jgi:hypothetical protein
LSTINEAMALLDAVLFGPKTQKPTVDQRFTQLKFEFQNLVNELNNTNLPWLTQNTTVSIIPGTQDYMVPGNIGQVLFAYANSSSDALGPVGLEFADFAEVSSDFYLFSPLDAGMFRDFNEVFALGSPAQLALFRENGTLKFRVPRFSGTAFESVTLVSSKGNWADGLTLDDESPLPGHHMLAIARAASNLLPGSEWAGDREYNLSQRQQLAVSLEDMKQRYAQAWMIAKRTMHADRPTYRAVYGGDD